MSVCCFLRPEMQNSGFEPAAVVELFTSEGCSSCPPADKLLAETIEQADNNKRKIYCLAFHVDYWNRLGWTDSFSSKQFTDRQKMYVDALHVNGAYTPQMIVNGRTEFVGSSKHTLDETLLSELNKKSNVEFTKLSAVFSEGQIKADYGLKGDFDRCHINFALVSLHVSTSVKRGENAGRQLEHSNVVRQFISVPALETGSIKIEHLNMQPAYNYTLIAYVQKDNGLNVIGAASVKPVAE